MTRHVPLHHRPQATRALVITSMDRLGPPPVRTWIPELLPNHAPPPGTPHRWPFCVGRGLAEGEGLPRPPPPPHPRPDISAFFFAFFAPFAVNSLSLTDTRYSGLETRSSALSATFSAFSAF